MVAAWLLTAWAALAPDSAGLAHASVLAGYSFLSAAGLGLALVGTLHGSSTPTFLLDIALLEAPCRDSAPVTSCRLGPYFVQNTFEIYLEISVPLWDFAHGAGV